MKISVVMPLYDGSAAARLRKVVVEERLPCEVITVTERGADILDLATTSPLNQVSRARHVPSDEGQLSTTAALQFGVAHSGGDIIYTLAQEAPLDSIIERLRALQRELQSGFPEDTLRLPAVPHRSRASAVSESGRYERGEDEIPLASDMGPYPDRKTAELLTPTARKPKTLIIVPTYNEQGNIESFIYAVLAAMPWADILVIDDNSPDGTGMISDTLAILLRQVQVIHREGKLGLGTAYVLGFRYAITHDYDLIYEMDADFSHDPRCLHRMADLSLEADLVIGSRYIREGGLPDWSALRRFISRAGNWFAQAVLGIPVHDCTSGFRCYRSSALASLHLEHATSEDYAFQVEMAYAMWKSGYQVRETPITFHDRRVGASKMSVRIFGEAFWWVVTTRLHGSPVVADRSEAVHSPTSTKPGIPEDKLPGEMQPASRLVAITTAVLCFLTVIAYLLGGHLLYTQWRVPVGNTGVYAQGMYEISRGHLLGFSPFVGADIWADAGEFIAYPLAPLYALLGINSLWLIQGLSVAASEVLAVWLARYYKLATWQQLGILAAVACNPFVIANFVSSWDFNILFVPALLGLVVLSHATTSTRRLLIIAALTLLTCMIKDEVSVVLAFWGVTALVFRIGDRRASAVIAVLGVCYYVGLQAGLSAAGIHDNQIAKHYAQIGGAGGILGVMKYAFAHPLNIASQLFSNRGYFFELAAASGGAILLDSSGLACLFVGVINALGGGALGRIMANSDLEFTLINVPFLFVSLVRLNARLKGPALSFFVILAFTVLYFGANNMPYTSAAAAAPPGEIAQLNKLETWYWRQPVRPAYYGQQVTAIHFLGTPVTGVVDDSLNVIATEADQKDLGLLIAFDQLVTHDDAYPNRMVTITAGLLAAGDLTSVDSLSSRYLHVYYLNVPRFLSQGFQGAFPPNMSIEPWMWISNQVTLDLAPGTYQLSHTGVSVSNATLQGAVISVSGPAPTVPVTLSGSGNLTVTRIS
ncbi:MAG: glycosyltransferase [Ktedonobacterales bacterium]